jgi:hypothetical protein
MWWYKILVNVKNTFCRIKKYKKWRMIRNFYFKICAYYVEVDQVGEFVIGMF